MKTWKNLTVEAFVAVVAIFGIAVLGTGCVSGPPPQDQIRELKLVNGIYRPLDTNVSQGFEQWFMIQPSVSGDLHVQGNVDVTNTTVRIDVYDSNNRWITRSFGSTYYPPKLVITVEAGEFYFFKVDHPRCMITAFTDAQKEEAERLAAEERSRVEAERAEANRQAQIARQEQQQAEQTRLANLYQQAGNNFGNLRNTSRTYSSPVSNSSLVSISRYDFGDGNYLCESGYIGASSTKTGTFRVNGDTVIFLSEGVYSFGTILGTTLTIDGKVHR